ncbi:MAG: hypothetical protein ACRC6T_05190 [Sarcina sp.]
MFRKKSADIETRYTSFIILEDKKDSEITYLLRVKDSTRALVTIDKDKTIVDNDYVSSEDLRFLLLQLIDNYKTLKYTGDELCILEYGINIEFDDDLCEEIIIDKASILDTKSFQYKENVEIRTTLI